MPDRLDFDDWALKARNAPLGCDDHEAGSGFRLVKYL